MTRDKSLVWHPVDPSTLHLEGAKVAIIGGTGGIGRALSRFLASRGATVVVVGRTFRDSDVPGIEFLEADLGLMREAKRVGQALPAETLDLVIFTTGIFVAPRRQETAEGIERDLAVSYLSSLVILREIAPRLGKARPAIRWKPRVFVMGYPASGNELLVLDAARRYPNARFFGLDPGLMKGMVGLLTPSRETYSRRVAPLLVSPDLEAHNGAMFDWKGHAILPSPRLTDTSYVDAFITASEELVSRASIRLAS
jgi:NAD(P)-dependent dehydrogenase (short-subunit alcohol dehydrogenase family)